MLPTLYDAPGGLGIHTYGLFIMLAFAAAFTVTHTRVTAAGIHPMRLFPVYLGAAAGGLAGGRLLYAMAVEPGPVGFLSAPWTLFQGSGFAFYGGLIGGFVAVATIAIPSGIPAWKLADIAAPSVLVGYGVGRLGCFFAGCCHGAIAPIGANPRGLLPSEGLLDGQIWVSGAFPFVTTEFHGGVGRLLDAPLYPTQLWSVLAGLGLAAAMLALWDKRRFDGQFAALYLIVEPVFRFFIEAFRADQRGYVITFPANDAVTALFPGVHQAGSELAAAVIGITTSQGIGLLMVPVGLVIYAARRNAGVAPEIPLDPDDPNAT